MAKAALQISPESQQGSHVRAGAKPPLELEIEIMTRRARWAAPCAVCGAAQRCAHRELELGL